MWVNEGLYYINSRVRKEVFESGREFSLLYVYYLLVILWFLIF